VASISIDRAHAKHPLRLTLTHHPDGVEPRSSDIAVVYDVENNKAHFGATSVAGPALQWELHQGAASPNALLSAEVTLDSDDEWILRCDRIDFPPGGIAHLHTHPGPGIRCQLFGELTVETDGRRETHGAYGAWFETGPDPVYAVASGTEDSAFVRVMLLPLEWEGKRTIRYVDPADADKPKMQTATVFFDRRIDL
jgi:quercetin dioxygenase-like cupin family protein